MVSGSVFKYQNHIAAFLCRNRPKEKLTKEKAEFACAASATTRGEVAFAKSDAKQQWVCANNVRDKSKFESSNEYVPTRCVGWVFLCELNYCQMCGNGKISTAVLCECQIRFVACGVPNGER